jgi:hypothetical protein
MAQGNWPAALTPIGNAIINGATGALVAKSGGIFGTASHPATGHCRVQLTDAIAETEDNILVVVTSDDDGGGAGSTRIASYGINSGATPPELDLYTRDAAGALADTTRLSVVIFKLA